MKLRKKEKTEWSFVISRFKFFFQMNRKYARIRENIKKLKNENKKKNASLLFSSYYYIR
jgi:hypothetical protein